MEGEGENGINGGRRRKKRDKWRKKGKGDK